jgi:sirohydrochlorin cobaltochelatase
MALKPAITTDHELLEARLKTLLPEEYQDSYEDVQPVPMASAPLKFAPDGRVAWDEIWGSFCDLAMAGGPPHRGTLLEPATPAEIALDPGRYHQVAAELCRGIDLVTGLAAEPSRIPGWLHVDCPSTGMAGWLARAITMENISAHVDGMILHLPAGPRYRLEKEIKNVVTSIAKTCHYWFGHTSVAQHRAIAQLFHVMESDSPLLQPPFAPPAAPSAAHTLRETIAARIQSQTPLQANGREYPGWLGIDCLNPRAAIWIMRFIVASNVLCRRQANSIYLPVNPSTDPTGARIAEILAHVYRLATAQGVL